MVKPYKGNIKKEVYLQTESIANLKLATHKIAFDFISSQHSNHQPGELQNEIIVR